MPHDHVGDRLGGPAGLEGPDPLEPGEVVPEPARRDAPEAVEEPDEPAVQVVHDVDAVGLRRADVVLPHVEGLERLRVCPRAVGGDDRAARDLALEEPGRAPGVDVAVYVVAS